MGPFHSCRQVVNADIWLVTQAFWRILIICKYNQLDSIMLWKPINTIGMMITYKEGRELVIVVAVRIVLDWQ